MSMKPVGCVALLALIAACTSGTHKASQPNGHTPMRIVKSSAGFYCIHGKGLKAPIGTRWAADRGASFGCGSVPWTSVTGSATDRTISVQVSNRLCLGSPAVAVETSDSVTVGVLAVNLSGAHGCLLMTSGSHPEKIQLRQALGTRRILHAPVLAA